MTTLLYIVSSIIIIVLGVIAGYYHSAYKTAKNENEALIKSICEFVRNQEDADKIAMLIAKNTEKDDCCRQCIEDGIVRRWPDLISIKSQTSSSNESAEG